MLHLLITIGGIDINLWVFFTVLHSLDQVLQPIKATTQATGFTTLMEIMQTAPGYLESSLINVIKMCANQQGENAKSISGLPPLFKALITVGVVVIESETP